MLRITENIDESWVPLITSCLYKEPLRSFSDKILRDTYYIPKTQDVFKVFETPIKKIKVVILGLDPYPAPGNPTFGFFKDIKVSGLSKTLQNIYKEIGTETPDISKWTEQGVFLLNYALTISNGNVDSHLQYWEQFTKDVIKTISYEKPCIWIFWGKKAQKFIPYVSNKIIMDKYDDVSMKTLPNDQYTNYVFSSPHPKDEKGFFGCKHFEYTNQILKKTKREIKW